MTVQMPPLDDFQRRQYTGNMQCRPLSGSRGCYIQPKKKISSHDTVVISGEDRIQQPSHVLRMTVLTQELHVAEVLAGSDLVL